MQCCRFGLISVLLLAAVPAYAQFGQANPLLATGLASRLRWVSFDIVGGRIVASSVHVGTNMNSSTNGNDGRRERLTIDLTNPAPNVRYELAEKSQELNLEVTDGEQILIRHLRKAEKGDTQSVEYVQTPQEDLSLTIENASGKRVATGPTLWHLVLQEPDASKQLLAPTLEMLKPGWKLATVAEAIEEALCQSARLRPRTDRDRWSNWVGNLSSQRYADRQSAERHLLGVGRELLPFLRGLDRSTLDAEQWRRVRNIISALDNQQGDSVEQTVSLLAGDPRAWVSLLDRDDEAKRRLAFEQLKSLSGPIEFDPSAPPGVRQEQVRKLRERFTPAKAEPADADE